MISVFAGGRLPAGLFTLLPGRLVHAVLFGSGKPLRRRVQASDFATAPSDCFRGFGEQPPWPVKSMKKQREKPLARIS